MLTGKRYLWALVTFVLLLAPTVPLGTVAAASTSGRPRISVVAAGFDNPRGVAVSDGRVLVGESGHGGDVCLPSIYGPNCVGLNSQISAVDPNTGRHHPLVSGLFSTIFGAVGPIGIEGISIRHGSVMAILGLNSLVFPDSIDCSQQPPDCAAVLDAARHQSGHLISVSENGTWRSVASVGEFDFNSFSQHLAENPNQKHEANPFGVLATGSGTFVTDAAAGDLDLVSSSGQVGLVHYFHFDPPAGSFPSDEVPTCVVRANGRTWMGDLNGRLFRLDGSTPTQIPVVDRSGTSLTHHVTGCSTDDANDGVIYLVNMWRADGPPTPDTANTGSVVRYDVERGRASTVVDGLNFPSMLAVGRGGALYVSANSTCPASGGQPPVCEFMGQTSGVLLKITPSGDDQ
jgi:hypothetical protein